MLEREKLPVEVASAVESTQINYENLRQFSQGAVNFEELFRSKLHSHASN